MNKHKRAIEELLGAVEYHAHRIKKHTKRLKYPSTSTAAAEFFESEIEQDTETVRQLQESIEALRAL